MSDIVFVCPHCKKSLKVDASAVGMQVECPECGQEIEIPASQPAEEENVEAYRDDAPEESTQAPEPQAPKPAPQAEHQSMTLPQFRELLEQTSRNIVPQLEAASAEIRRALE